MLTLYIELVIKYLFQATSTVIVYVFLGTTLEHFGWKLFQKYLESTTYL